jgi:hypothetical protein
VRHLNTFRNFAVCFSFLSPITGLTGTFNYTWTVGWAWGVLAVAQLCGGAPVQR